MLNYQRVIYIDRTIMELNRLITGGCWEATTKQGECESSHQLVTVSGYSGYIACANPMI